MSSQLLDVQKAFADWRGQGHRNRYKNPVLRAKAVKLLETHSPCVVSKALGITVQTLKAWQKSDQTDCSSSSVNQAFMSMPMPMPMSMPMPMPEACHQIDANSEPTSPRLQLSLPNGIAVTLSEQPLSATVEFICALSKEFSQ